MQIKIIDELPREWWVDYGPARERAIRWLGEGYLLAHEINRPWVRAPLSATEPASKSGSSARPRAQTR